MPTSRIRSRIVPVALICTLLACDGRSPTLPAGGEPVPRTLQLLGGDGQHGLAGAELPDAITVGVLDAGGRGLAGWKVVFAVVSGGGAVTPQTVTSDERGLARARWTLGAAAADSQVVEARLQGLPAVRLRAHARPDQPASLAVTGSTPSEGQVGAVLADSLAVTVRDRHGNPLVGVDVAWEVAAGGGAVSPTRTVTGPGGVSRAQWTLGTRVDSAQAVIVRVAGVDSVAFTARAVTTGVPLQLAKRGGDGQRGPAGSVLADSLGVVLRMPDGRPVVGALVSWSVPPQAGTVEPGASRTDASGAASAVWRLGTRPGLMQATATVDEGTLTFTSLVEAAAPAAVAAVAGGGEGPIGGALVDSLAVRVTDAYGNPVPGAEVAWAAVAGGGSLHPALGRTDAEGVARAAWTLGPWVGAPGQAASATVADLPPVTFQATATTRGVPLQLARVAGDAQTGPVASALADSLQVRLRTAAGQAVGGAEVTWAVTAGGGRLSASTVRTDEQGLARVAWTMGTIAGAAHATATVDEGTLVFSAAAVAGPPAAVAAARGDGQSATRGTTLPDSLVARVTDAYGNAVAGAEVWWSVAAGGGHLQQRTSTTAADGTARTRYAVGFTPGANAVTAAVDGAGAASFTATGTAGALTLKITHSIRTTFPWMSTFWMWGTSTAYVTDAQGRRAVGAAITWESNQSLGLAPPTDWDTSSVARVDAYYGVDLPYPYWIIRFEDQRILHNVPYYVNFVFSVELPEGPGPYSANDTIPVLPRMTYWGRGPNYGWDSYAEYRIYDDNGWAVTADMYRPARWPLGSRTGTRRLTVCLPEPYAFPEECVDTTITVNP
ncbi:MAG TPA: Ig-like domain-containing protein [Longimicrobium sp.]|nr:Ig-like domain-containing protein [Longimicrobium sp.]